MNQSPDREGYLAGCRFFWQLWPGWKYPRDGFLEDHLGEILNRIRPTPLSSSGADPLVYLYRGTRRIIRVEPREYNRPCFVPMA